ncbi:MAG TPA: FAD-dependent oxidoreductase [Rugosimonospora sp.]|nr:FAD-dependent oxidoreductase [Rugosimonospora sp.]
MDLTPPSPAPSACGQAPTYWLSTVGIDTFAAPAALPPSVDVAVVGGGVMGVATAYWLARRGLAPLLLERGRIGGGASGRNAGIFLPGVHPLEDATLVRSVLADEDIDAGHATPGHLALASSPAVFDEYRAEVSRRPATAAPLHALDRGACEELLGMRIAAHFAGGRWLPGGGVIQPARLVYGLGAAAARHGARMAPDTEVTGVRRTGPEGYTVHTRRGSVRAGQVVLAGNTGVARLSAALAPLIRPVRGQVMATRPLPPVFRLGLAVDFGSVYWRQDPHGVVVIGGCRDQATGDAERTDVLALHEPVQRALGAFLPAAFPGFPPFTVGWRWAGIMDGTADGRPLIGAVPGADGLWVIAGFGGHGLPPALGAGQALTETIASGRPAAALTLFDPGRPSAAGGPPTDRQRR